MPRPRRTASASTMRLLVLYSLICDTAVQHSTVCKNILIPRVLFCNFRLLLCREILYARAEKLPSFNVLKATAAFWTAWLFSVASFPLPDHATTQRSKMKQEGLRKIQRMLLTKVLTLRQASDVLWVGIRATWQLFLMRLLIEESQLMLSLKHRTT